MLKLSQHINFTTALIINCPLEYEYYLMYVAFVCSHILVEIDSLENHALQLYVTTAKLSRF